MLMRLWDTKSEENAEIIATFFVEVGLAAWEMVGSESELEPRFSLLDSVYDFAVSEVRQHGETVDAHNILLDGYSYGREDELLWSEDTNVRWWSRIFEDDGYLHEHLCRRLVGGWREKELCELLLTPLWAERQTEVNGIMYLEVDFDTGMAEIAESEETKEALRLIATAISLSSVHIGRNITELWFQLHARLKGYIKGNRVIEKYVKSLETDAKKPRVLAMNRVLQGAEGRIRKVRSVTSTGVLCMALFHDEERIACGYRDGNVVVVNIRRSEIERKVQAYTYVESVSSITVTQNGTGIVTKPIYGRCMGCGEWSACENDELFP